ncbi:MAG: hypothetical protein JNL74_14040, partial [Fibrobacteres bacterium]|nr:hypothetical protein [Fibrobacterota bacterium]
MYKLTVAALILSFTLPSASAELTFIQKPILSKSDSGWNVSFEMSAETDVEVAIVDTATDAIICHLAAGKLGAKAPPPLTVGSLHQVLKWDGRDDYRTAVQNTSNLDVRVRAGMSAKIDKIAGGDPYAFFSRDMRGGNHNIWTIAGIEGKPDGSVYLYGSSNQMGVYTVRKYDFEGNYIKTVFPFPSGMAASKVSGWGVNTKADGTYAPKVARGWGWPIYTSTPINLMGGFGPQPLLLHNRDTSKLTISAVTNFDLFSFNTDGSIDPNSSNQFSGGITVSPRLIASNNTYNKNIAGPLFISYTPDSQSFYMSGVCSTGSAFWREGQIWKVNATTRVPQVWFSLTSNYTTNIGAGGNYGYTALHGTAVDDSHHVFVCNRIANQILVLDSNANILKTISVLYPDAVTFDKSTGALYVASRNGYQGVPGTVKLMKFNNWRTDTSPAFTLKLCDVNMSLLSRDRVYIL